MENMGILIALSSLSWIGIVKLVAIFVLLGLVAYFAKKYLDEEAYNAIIAKITAFEVKSEYEITGDKKGAEKLANTVSMIETSLTKKEKKILNKKGLLTTTMNVFNTIAPFLARKL